MKFRLAAYTPFTSEKWILPKPLSYNVVYILNSLHSLEFTYPDNQNGSDVITPDKGYPYEYAVEYFNPATETWDEPLGSRFIGMKVTGDQIEEMPTKKYSNLSLKWLFRKAKVWGTGGVANSDERVFKDVTIGSILITLFTEAYERGIKITNPENIGFTDKVDSSGASWGGTVSMAFPINMSLEEVLNDLTEQGFIDWDMQGRRTLVWKADSASGLARDKRSVYLQNLTGTTAAPEEVSFESMMTTARVLGETQSWEFSNNLSSPWGRLEDVVSQSGAIDPITAKEASEKILLEGERPIKTHTKELSGYSNLQPLIDVRVGDWVRGQTNRDRTKPTSFEDMRIQEISLEVTGADYTWNVSMGDRRSDMLEKIARRQTALSGGSSGGTSRTPSGGTAQTGDWRVPTTPTNFTVRVNSHLDADTNRYKGRAVFTWFDDHMGLDKYDNSLSPQARRGYEVSYREAGTTNWTTLAWYGPDADKSPQIYYPLDVINPATNLPYTYEFRLRTLGAETYSSYTTAVAVQMVADQEAPEKPSKPITEASLGVITVSWDKKTSSGKAMPLDFSHLIVESRHYADTEVIKEVGQIYGNSLPLVGLTEGVPYQFRFVAVDTAGNRSTPSDWSVATVIQPLVDTESIQDALSSANDALNAAVAETESRLTELNRYMSESFGEFTDDMQSVWSAINSPDVFAQAEAPKDPKTGQLWIDTDNSNIISLWDGNTWVQLRDGAIQELQRALETKSTTYFSDTEPQNPTYGDLWFNPSNNNEVRRWDGSWVTVTDPQISTALSQAQSAKAAADGKIQTFLSPTAPSPVGLGDGDLWFDSDDGNRMYRWNDATKTWVDAQDTSIAEFYNWKQDLISSLEGGEYGRMSTYYQDTAPVGPMPGDLWVDTSTGGTLKIWNSSTSTWDPVTDPTLSETVVSMASDVDALYDSVIQTYVQPNPPVSTDSHKLSLGDLWFDSDDNNKMYRYDPFVTTNGGWSVVQDKNIDALRTAVNTKITTHYGGTAPTTKSVGDLWFNQANNNEVKRWNGTTWVAVTDPNIKAALDKANTAQATADGKIESFFQISAPASGMSDGDLWFDTDDNNKLYRWNASASRWDAAQDGRIDGLLSWQTTLVKDLTAGKYNRVSTFYQGTAPSSPNTGDLWVDTANSGTLKTWTGTDWAVVTDPSLMDSITAISEDVDAIKDGVIETYAQTSAPVASGSVKLSLGDLWFDTDDNNKLYRYDPSVTANGGWVAVQDKNISALQSAVASKITTYYATTAPSSPVQGDLWIDQSTGNTLKRWTNGAWVVITDADVKAALNKANDAKAIADGKVQTFFQTSAPPAAGLADGDLWFDTDDGNKMYRWDGVSATKSWVSVRDGFITNFPNWEDDFIKAIRAGDYARVSTFYQTIAPADPIDGDLWMDTATGVLKRFNKSANRWDVIQDAALKRSITDLGTDIEAIQDKVINTYVSPTAPTGTASRPLAVGDLWFDSSNSNKLYRRSSSGSWDPVSDTSATEALAKTIPTVIHSTTVADSTSKAANGSTWFQHLPSITSPVVAQWTKEDGKWVPVTVSSEVIANLDVGKLTAGSASLSTAVVDKLFANIFAAKKISASEMTVAPSSVFPDPLFQGSSGYSPWNVVGGGIELSGTGKQSGGYSENLEVVVSPGDEYVISFDKTVYPDTNRVSTAALYARYYDQSGVMLSSGNSILSHNSGDSLTKSESWVVPEGVYKVQFGFFIQASVVEGTRIRVSNPQMVRKVGGVLIKDGGVTAEHITASQSLTAKMAKFLTVTANMIQANAIKSSHLDVGSVEAKHMNFQGPLVNGEGYQLVIDSTGIKFYYVSGTSGGPSGGPERKLVSALTGESAGDNGSLYSIVDRITGMTLASMTEGGDINGVQGNFENDISVGGNPVFSPGGLMDAYPRGAVPGSAVAVPTQGSVRGAGEWGFAEISLLAEVDRAYRINVEHFILKNTGDREVRFSIRMTNNGSEPTVDSTIFRSQYDAIPYTTTSTVSYHQMGGTSMLFRPASNSSASTPRVDGNKILYRFLFTVYKRTADIEFVSGGTGPFVAWIEDVGPDIEYTGSSRDNFKAIAASTPTDTSTGGTSKTLYTKTYSVASHKNFYVTLPGPVSKGEYVWSTYTRDNLFFGGFDSRNLWSFATMSSMTSDLSGADIKSIKVSFKVSDTYSYTGANVGVWIHGYSSYGTQSPSSLGNYITTISGAKEGSTYSVGIPARHFPMFKSGGLKGIAFGFNSHVNLPLNGRILKSSIKFTISYYK